MHRIMPFSLDDLAANPKGAQESLNSACCRRGTKYRLRGLAQIEEHVYFFLLPRQTNDPREDYVLAPLEEIPSHEDVIGILSDRWAAGFDLVGSFDVFGTLFMVYARNEEKKQAQ